VRQDHEHVGHLLAPGLVGPVEHVDEGEQAAWAVSSSWRRRRRTLDEVRQTSEAAGHDRANDTHGKSEEWMGDASGSRVRRVRMKKRNESRALTPWATASGLVHSHAGRARDDATGAVRAWG